MASADNTIDDLEAMRVILETLRKLPAEDHARVLRYVHEKLGVATPAVTASSGSGSGQGAAVAPKPDIRTFIETKKPTNDVQFAAAVAYFYAFEAPPAERKPEISKDDLQEATRLAHRDRLKRPIMTLHNANSVGYLDKGGRGTFKINTVGENLVAMALPATGVAPRPQGRGKKSTKHK